MSLPESFFFVWSFLAGAALAQTPASPALAGTEWRLASFDGKPPAPESRITLSFQEKQLGAKVCNVIGGAYTLTGTTLRGHDLISTQMACLGPRDEIERALLHDLGTGLEVSLEGARLRLTGGHVFEYESQKALGPPPAAGLRVTGTVAYRERIALPPGAEIEVTLADVSRAGADGGVVSRQVIPAAGRSAPFSFELPYTRGDIDPARAYAVRARITVGGELWFSADQAVPVLTRGAPARVDLMLKRVRAR
jgi:putative lipoprotein